MFKQEMESAVDVIERLEFTQVIDEIRDLNWREATATDMVAAAWAYYHFSVQFRESLQVARSLHPHDEKLRQLEQEECDTSNLSPWPGVALPGEKMNHDEFMRRTLALLPIEEEKARFFEFAGQAYLDDTRSLDATTRANSIASYEDGGLETVFRAMLTAPDWDNAVLRAFRHFLSEHVRFDSDPEQGHGALSRHMRPDDRVLPLWVGFRDLLVRCVPRLAA